jgi:hypothetical protein
VVSLVVIFHVNDYERWRAASADFVRHAGAEGAVSQLIYRAVDDPDEVMVMIKARTLEDAERMMRRREDLRASLDAAGISVYPAAFVGVQVEEINYE